MKEMSATGHDCHRECLGARPVHHGGQGHGVVLLAMDNQRAAMGLGRHGRDGEAAGGRPHEHGALDVTRAPEPLQGVAGDEGAEGEPRQRDRTGGRCLVDDREQVVQLSAAFVVGAGAAADAPEIEAHGRPPTRDEGPGERLHDLVVHGAAEERMGMGDHGHAERGAAPGRGGRVAQRLDGAGRAGESQAFSLGVHLSAVRKWPRAAPKKAARGPKCGKAGV